MELYLRPRSQSPNPNDNDDDDVDLDRPLLIPLRLPASLLSSLSRESRLDVSYPNNSDAGGGCTTGATTAIDSGGGDVMTLTITRNPISGKQQARSRGVEMYSMGVVDNHEEQTATDWYHKSVEHALPGMSTSSSQNNELQYIGTTKTNYCVPSNKSSKIAPTTNKLKEIGERTRRLLEEERKKRKEIVRLDDDEQCILPLPDKEAPPTLATTQSTPNSDIPPSSLTTEKKMIKRNGATTARKRKRREVAANIDGWMPNVDDLLTLPTSNSAFLKKGDADQQQSSIVRLHGLPMGVKPENIRKFFHGLNPGLIFVLPTFSHRIHGCDAAAAAAAAAGYINDGNNRQCIVKRHSNTFRVFVKFTSYPVANAAIERTGESIEIDEEWQNEGASLVGEAARAKKMVGASISMSPVSKHDASFMQKHMAIHTQKGEGIMTTAKRIEKQLGSVITQLIWEMAVKKMNLSHRIRGIGDATDPECSVPTNESQYQTLAKLYNQLIDTHEQLELENGIIFTHAFDPTIDDSAHRITQSVSNWLLDRVSTIGRLLNASRQWLNLGMHN